MRRFGGLNRVKSFRIRLAGASIRYSTKEVFFGYGTFKLSVSQGPSLATVGEFKLSSE